MNDAALRETVERNIFAEGLTEPGMLEVKVKAGRVHVSGVVPSYAARAGVLLAARRIAGVQNVFADVRVLPCEVTDDELTARARALIQWSALVPAGSVTATVKDGVLTLRGSLPTRSQHQGLLAQLVPLAGIFDLVDRIGLGAGNVPAPLAARVRAALRSHAGEDAERVRFDVADDGSVRLEGELSDWQSHHAVVDAVQSLEGVARVDDAITIDD